LIEPRPLGRFFLPGPVEVHPEVLAELTRPMITHRGPVMAALLQRIQPALQDLFRTTQPVFISTSSATGLMEAAILAGVERRVLVAVGGYFGERFAKVAEACGKEVVRVMVPEGRTIEPHHLERFLSGPDVDAVAVVHSETSTGALAPLEAIGAAVRRHPNVMLLVDAVSSLGGLPVDTDAWGLDFVFTGSQKALALPPGLALGTASPRLIARARTLPGRGWYFDVVKLLESTLEWMPAQTPAIPLLFALERQLQRIADSGGFAARYARHQAMAAVVEEWCASHPGFELLAVAGRRSRTVSAIRLPPALSAPDLVRKLDSAGWTVTTGLPPVADSVLRIGHMGDLGPDHVAQLLAELALIAG
jgi:aspartate aminotransferase-like enzyme